MFAYFSLGVTVQAHVSFSKELPNKLDVLGSSRSPQTSNVANGALGRKETNTSACASEIKCVLRHVVNDTSPMQIPASVSEHQVYISVKCLLTDAAHNGSCV